ncbi:MAG: trigger factor [Caldithrix sp.]|nr:trigger factor [Caldithrix sp.]
MIQSEVRNISSCKKELKITMDKEELEPIREKETKRVRNEVQFPGFRKGKAPLQMIKKRFGDVIDAYTMESAADHAMREVVKEKELSVVGTPEAKELNINDDGALETTIEFETYPEIEFKKYTGFEFTKDEYVITDAYIDKTIDQIRKDKAAVSATEGPLKEGHKVKLDMQELDESGVPVVGNKYEDMQITIGEGRFDEELEKQMLGMKSGEQKTISKKYPDDFPQEEYAGKTESYLITVKEIEEEELPELTDEFASELGEDIDSVEDLREKSRKQLEIEYKKQAENRLMQDLGQKLLDENPFDLPQTVIDNYLDNIVRDVKTRNPQANEEDIRQHYAAEAEFTIKWHFFREQLAKKENIEVTEDDVQKFLDTIEDEKVREFYANNEQMLERAKEDILMRKVQDFLLEQSEIKPNEITLD